MDHTETDQASILRFIEDNWHTGQIGDASADAASMKAMFNFHHQRVGNEQPNEHPSAVASITNAKHDKSGDQDRKESGD